MHVGTENENDHHWVSITFEMGYLYWKNKSGCKWPLTYEDGVLKTDDTCDYGVQDIQIEEGDALTLTFQDEPYVRDPDFGMSKLAGDYECAEVR
jgi:hypothetical protein